MAGSWGIRRRAECQTATPFGDGDWVADFDDYLARAADRGEAVEPLTTIGWLMWHIGSMPGRLAQLDFLGGSRTPREGWTSCYLNVPALGDEPGPVTYGTSIIAATLNEVSHHGTQICMLRDLYRATGGRPFAAEGSPS